MANAKWKFLAAGTVLSGLLAGASAGHAQDAAEPYFAALEVAQYYTDNVFFGRPYFPANGTYQRRLGDWITVIKPTLGYRHNYEGGFIGLEASARIGRFARYTSENYVDLDFSARGRHNFSPDTIGVWGLGLSRAHEARNSLDPSDLIGISPTTYWHGSAFAALSHRSGDNVYKLGVTYDGYDYRDVATPLAPFIVNQDDRDRHMVTIGGRYTRQMDNGSAFYVDGTADIRAYTSPQDDNGFNRDSAGTRLSAGWQTDIGENGRLELYGGLVFQDFSDPRFETVVAPDYGALYSWRDNGFGLTAEIRRSLDETTLAGASSYLRTTAALSVQQDLPGNMRLFGGISVADLDFQGIDRRDMLTNAYVGLRKYYTSNLYFGAEASFAENDSSDAANDYTETSIMARIGVDSAGRPSANDDGGAGLEGRGLYFGLGAEIGLNGTMLGGPRQNTNGSLIADFGDFRPAGRLIAGWGAGIGATYLGVEADARFADGGWSHSRLPGGRVFSVKDQESYALSFLGGRLLPSGSLVYARAGIRTTNFETNYIPESGRLMSSSGFLTGFEYGVGVRTPLSDSLALSLEYAHAQYPDYLMGPRARPDAFGNVSSDVRLALTWHFGGVAAAEQAGRPAHDYSGAYWGLQGGFNALQSYTTGNRFAGNPPVASVLRADYADTGYSAGAIAGFNIQRGRLVAGAEAEAEADFVEWKQERAPSGRSYSVAQDMTLGLSGRLGYVTDAGAMIYGRAGIAVSRMQIDFANPGITLSQTDWKAGWRVGGGIEVPVSDMTSMRFDYSYTDFGTLSLVTPPGTETYDTSQSQFRIGYLRKF